MTPDIRAIFSIGFGLALLILAAVGVVAVYSITSLVDTVEWTNHSYEELRGLESIFGQTEEAALTAHWFSQTGDEGQLGRYQTAVAELDRSYSRLHELAVDTPGRDAQLDDLDRKVTSAVALFDQDIRSRKEGQLQERQAGAAIDETRQAIARVEAQLREIENAESVRLAQRDEEMRAGARRAISVISAGGFVAILLVGLATVFINWSITRRREAEHELRKLSGAVQHSPAAVIITDVNGKIEYVNPRFSEMTLYSSEEVRGQDLAFQRASQDVARDYQGLMDTVVSGGLWREVFEARKKNGDLCWVSSLVSGIVDARGAVRHLVEIQQDVTAAAESARAMQEAKEVAEVANRAKSEFLASMSHEIRTPMNAIVGMADLLQEAVVNPDQRKYIQVLKSASDSLLNLINNILDLSKIEAMHVDLESTPLDLREVVERACEIMSVRAHQKGIELSVRLRPGVPGCVEGDPARLRQIITNLVGNAVKFTERGEVVLEVEVNGTDSLHSTEGSPRQSLHFSVRDTGIGIPPEKLDTIFDRFTQADSSTTRKYGGSGLGLSITKGLVELMGGRIWVESEVGRGSTFHFVADFGRVEGSVQRPKLECPEIRGLKVLVVDDNATNRLILRESLAEWGAVVFEADDGKTGVADLLRASASDDPYQLVLLDRRMPGMDGFEVLSQIRQTPSIAEVTVMMLTSDNQGGDIVRCHEIGVAAYLIKPIKRSELQEAILVALDRPVVAVQSPNEPAESRDVTVGEGLSILLVEDSEDNRFLVQSYLRGSRDHIVTAENGEEALQAFATGRYDLVLMDMQMPVMDGYAATRKIRQLEREQGLNATPIIALTANALAEDLRASLKAGCDAHLTKPIKKSRLLEVIREYAGRRANMMAQ